MAVSVPQDLQESPKMGKGERSRFPKLECQGHRIYGKLAAPNTLEALRRAGADPVVESVEFDVRVTSDGVLVVTHGTEGSDTGSSSCVEDLPWEAVSRMKAEQWMDGIIEAGGRRGEEKTNEVSEDIAENPDSAGNDHLTTCIPNLETVLAACMENKLRMNIDLKDATLVEQVLTLIGKLQIPTSQFRISSFLREAIDEVQQKAPSFPVGMLFNGRCVDEVTGQLMARSKTPDDFVRGLRAGIDAVHVCAETVTNEEVDAAHRAGLQVLAWFPGIVRNIEEDVQTFRRLEEMGVDVCCTNRPDLFAKK